jgi:hypothetical protein
LWVMAVFFVFFFHDIIFPCWTQFEFCRIYTIMKKNTSYKFKFVFRNNFGLENVLKHLFFKNSKSKYRINFFFMEVQLKWLILRSHD